MVTSVLAGFNEFIQAISISGDQQATSTARKDRIVELLKKENFTIIDAFPTGSIPKKTGVKGCDLDVMVVLVIDDNLNCRLVTPSSTTPKYSAGD